jgi:uncharacterized protein YmfQ (DUF2313 family)
MAYPAWKDMTAREKFEFLNEWCARLSVALEDQRAVSQSLQERLRQVEAKVAGIA